MYEYWPLIFEITNNDIHICETSNDFIQIIIYSVGIGSGFTRTFTAGGSFIFRNFKYNKCYLIQLQIDKTLHAVH